MRRLWILGISRELRRPPKSVSTLTCYFATIPCLLSLRTQLLEDAGFEVRSCALVPRRTVLPGDLVGWLRTFFLADFVSKITVESDPGTCKSL